MKSIDLSGKWIYNVINLIGQLNKTLRNVINIVMHKPQPMFHISKQQGENTCQPKYPN